MTVVQKLHVFFICFSFGIFCNSMYGCTVMIGPQKPRVALTKRWDPFSFDVPTTSLFHSPASKSG